MIDTSLFQIGFQQIVRQINESDKNYRILIIGLDNSGKTTILKSYLNQNIDEIEPTLGFQIKSSKITINNKQLQLTFWDIGGQRTIRTFWQNFYENTNGLIYVIDSSDKRRLEIAKETLQNLLQAERLQGAPVLILANKQDLETAMPKEQIEQYIGQFPSRITTVIGCSARTKQGINEGIQWLVNEMLKLRNTNDNIDDLELIW